MNIIIGDKGVVSGSSAVTIGMFDGLHLGHMSLLENVIARARENGRESVAVTFDPHPRIVLSDGDTGLKFLTSMEEKISLFEKTGLNHLLVLNFSQEMSQMSSCDFVKEILIEKLNLKHLVIGYDHHFGKRSSNDSFSISECAEKYDFDVTRIEPYSKENEKVSSTRIRNYLEEGNLERANILLGYNYFLHGRVVSGKMIGRDMGFPTANIIPLYDYKLIPSDGVYAVEVTFKEKVYKSMLYIGTRPTLEVRGKRIIEANLFDFSGNLYDEVVSISFKRRIRDDMRFSSREELTEQIIKDKELALRLLS